MCNPSFSNFNSTTLILKEANWLRHIVYDMLV